MAERGGAGDAGSSVSDSGTTGLPPFSLTLVF